MIKLAIVGCGAIAEMAHIPAVQSLKDVEIVALIDLDMTRAEKLAEKFNVSQVMYDLSEVAHDIDSVILATPPHVRHLLAKKAFDAGLHVFCEKPLANSARESFSIVEYAKSSGKVCAVAHTYRFADNRQYLKKYLDNKIGKSPIKIKVFQGSPASWLSVSGYSYKKELTPGGVVLIEGIHTIDFLIWLFGIPKIEKYIDDSLGGLESNAYMVLNFNENIYAELRLSRTSNLGNYIEFIVGNEKIEIDVWEMDHIKIDNKLIDVSQKKETEQGSIFELFYRQMNNFVQSIINNEKPMCPAEEAAQVITVIEEMYQMKKSRVIPDRAPIPGFMF